jgi:hypothetical protein
VQYGLIAEEVAQVYPELVIRDQNGRISGVRYDELAPMLLNVVQTQAGKNYALEQREKTVDDLQEQAANLSAALRELWSERR